MLRIKLKILLFCPNLLKFLQDEEFYSRKSKYDVGGSEPKQKPSRKALRRAEMKKKTARMEWLRVNIDKKNTKDTVLNKYNKQGSGMISSIAYSDGIIEIPEKISQINIGDKFNFYLFDTMFD